MKLAIVITHPIQHFVPLFRNLAKRPEITLKVFYCCDWGIKAYADPGFGAKIAWDVPLLDGYDYEFLPIKSRPTSLSFSQIDNPAIGDKLDQFRAQSVWIHGYAQKTAWRVWEWATGKSRMLYFGDSELLHDRPLRSKILKRMVLPLFFRRIDAFITIGDNNENYYRYYGVDPKKFHRGAFPVDISRFQNAVAEVGAGEREEIRQKYGLRPDGFVVVFLGKFISIKRPFDLIEAMSKVRNPKIQCLFIGSGELNKEMEGRISQRGLNDTIKMAGFVNQTEMPKILYAADVLAMCSEKDPHPLAVTESMAVGLPVVASDRIGCVGPTDSARPGVNTLVYPCGDTDALADRLQTLSNDAGLHDRMSRASRDLAWTQDVSVAGDAVIKALKIVEDR